MATSTCENISECGKITMNNKSATINYLSNIAQKKRTCLLYHGTIL